MNNPTSSGTKSNKGAIGGWASKSIIASSTKKYIKKAEKNAKNTLKDVSVEALLEHLQLFDM
ncbi:MAG: hypothetical protein P857_160 [Candidatus Xenolissoclinum pacificiensis L6]|uniref:Uncharacterized protein n=1 Tax=Candidatus Xenolissoclinum pacificiensis L6 TaxID=1401685 RepID=W2UYY4_9RICK|nr:MAG: hypothetical protein P857_160 [Candidatus Xenolissoclinum pacificiensis L6]